MDWQTISGIVLVIGGGIAGAWQWLRAKTPKAVDLVEEVINRIQGEQSNGTISRKTALEHVEVLLQYFESKNNSAGVEALQKVVAELLTTKK